MNKKIIIISLLVSLAVVMLSIGIIFFTYRQFHYADVQGVALGNFKNFSELSFPAQAAFDLKQEIFSTYNNLSKITLALKPSQPIKLSVALKESGDNSVIRQKDIYINQILDYVQFIPWEFEPIPDSKNNTYAISIAGQVGEGSFTFYTVSPERYDGGKLFVNGAKNNEARLIIDWQHYRSNPWQTAIQRLAYAKPGVFNRPTTFIILFALFALTEFVMLYCLIYFLLFDKEINQYHAEK